MPEQNNDCEVTLAPLLKIAPVRFLLYRVRHTQAQQSGGRRETEKRGGREEEESEGWKGLQAVECKWCSFPRLPILLHLERGHSHHCVAAASSWEKDGAREALEGADTSSATSDSGPGFTAGRTVHCTVQ